MIEAVKIIDQCILEHVTDKKTIARRLVDEKVYDDIEKARSAVRRMLGSSGKPVPRQYQDLYDRYMAEVNKDDQYKIAQEKELKSSRCYIITAAMNNTPVHENFWNNLKVYADDLGAEIHVIALRYRNPTSVFTDSKSDTWTEEVLPYLDANRHVLFDKYHLMGDIKIQPTCEYPLSGLNGMTGSETCIFGHTRVHMQSMPVMQGTKPKFMFTTGCCTKPNYTDSKAGKKGAFHHIFGFVVVSENDVHYVTADDNGNFIDYDVMVYNGEITDAPTPPALVFGDIHYAHLSSEALQRISDRIKFFRPNIVVLQDVFDAMSCNPHTDKDPIMKVRRNINDQDNLAQEIEDTLDFIGNIAAFGCQVVLIHSNHENMLDRYLANMDWRKDIKNAVKYSELLNIALTQNMGVFAYLASKIPGVIALGPDDSYQILGTELGTHGHMGINGSKGSPQQYKNLSVKLVTGHSHSPCRLDGLCVVGCQDLYHDYNHGFSSWAVADVLITANGKRMHIF